MKYYFVISQPRVSSSLYLDYEYVQADNHKQACEKIVKHHYGDYVVWQCTKVDEVPEGEDIIS